MHDIPSYAVHPTVTFQINYTTQAPFFLAGGLHSELHYLGSNQMSEGPQSIKNAIISDDSYLRFSYEWLNASDIYAAAELLHHPNYCSDNKTLASSQAQNLLHTPTVIFIICRCFPCNIYRTILFLILLISSVFDQVIIITTPS